MRLSSSGSDLRKTKRHIDKMKTRLRFEEIEPFGGRWVTPITPERLQKRRYWIVIVLTIYNGFALFHGLREVVYWPSSAIIWLSSEQVKVYHDTDGTESYRATVPLKEFPYDLELQQRHRFELLSDRGSESDPPRGNAVTPTGRNPG